MTSNIWDDALNDILGNDCDPDDDFRDATLQDLIDIVAALTTEIAGYKATIAMLQRDRDHLAAALRGEITPHAPHRLARRKRGE
jgi:hypothetical protein